MMEVSNENKPIGKCFNCDCGTRPGPWHNEDCPAYMPTENSWDYLRKNQEKTDENKGD